MKMFLLVLIVTVLIVLLSFWGIGIKMIIKKNGEFKRHCSSVDPLTGEIKPKFEELSPDDPLPFD